MAHDIKHKNSFRQISNPTGDGEPLIVNVNWKQLPGGKIQAVFKSKQDGVYGIREKDMDAVQHWVSKSIPAAKRLSFDTWHIKEEINTTLFLMKWAS